MKKLTLLTMVLSIFLTSCAVDKIKERQQVPGAKSKILYSGFTPQESEQCSELAREKCPYFNFSFKLPYEACATYALDKATSLNANYMYIDKPFANIFGFNTGSYVAVMYKCKKFATK